MRNAGHMVPRDQPQAALAMIERWVADVLGAEQQQQRQVDVTLPQEQQQLLRQQAEDLVSPPTISSVVDITVA